MTNEAENNTIAVERIKEYTETSTEVMFFFLFHFAFICV